MGTVIKERRHVRSQMKDTEAQKEKALEEETQVTSCPTQSESKSQRTENSRDSKPPSIRISPEQKIEYAKLQQLEMETALKRLSLRMDNLEARVRAPKEPQSTASTRCPRGRLRRHSDRVDYYKKALVIPKYSPNRALHPKQGKLERNIDESKERIEPLIIPNQEANSFPPSLSPHNEYFQWFDAEQGGNEGDSDDEEVDSLYAKFAGSEEHLVRQAERLVASIKKTREINARLEYALKSAEAASGVTGQIDEESKQVQMTALV